ncbi:MAG: hypothetical protein ACLFQV_06620, partial [Vulcanimicrobiota bacterium]
MSLNKKAIIALLVVMLFCSVSGMAQAELIRIKTVEIDGQALAEFWIRGRLLGRLPRGENEELFNARVNNWSRRLEQIFENPPALEDITARPVPGQGIVFNKDTQILIFDKKIAGLLQTTPFEEAKKWAGNIRFALKKAPSLELKKNSLTIPLNEEVSLEFEGNFSGELEFFDYDPDIVEIAPSLNTGKINVKGLNLGKGYFMVRVKDIEKKVYFKVMERAGFVPRYMSLEVTGSPAPASMIKQAFESVVYYRCNPQPGAYVVTGNPIKDKNFKALNPGEIQVLEIPVKVDGPDYIGCKTMVHLTVQNVPYSRPDPQVLFVSNKPEVIKKDGVLMEAVLKRSEPARYFYHHKNAHHQNWREFYVALENPTGFPGTVFVSPIGAGPTPDEIFAGHSAASNFFDTRWDRRGWFVTLRPKSRYVVEKRLAKSDQTISGVGYLDISNGTMLNFSCYAVTPPNSPAPKDGTPPPEKPPARTSRGVFPAYIKLEPVHEVGGKYTYIYLGGEPYQTDLIDGHPNYGNYGAFYNIDIRVKNPHSEPRDAWIYFVPGGGMARGIFEVDGTVLETKMIRPAEKVL